MYYAVDWVDRVDFPKMREMRVQRLRETMVKHNLDALITFRAENIRYMTNMRPLWWPISFLSRNASMMTQTSSPTLYVTSGDAPRCRATMTWMDPDDIKPCGTMEEPGIVDTMIKQFVQTLKEKGFTKGRIGVDAGTFVMLEKLKAALPDCEVVDGDACVIEAKAILNPEEIKLMKLSSKIAEIGMQTAIDHIRTGARNCEILGEVMKVFYAFGMEVPQCNLIVTSGEETAPLHRFASDRTIRHGDLVFMDLGGCFNGYFSDFTRTVVHGKPNDMQKRIYNAVYEEMMVVHEMLKPGVTNEELNIAARNVIKKHGFEEWGFHGVLGHSINVSGLCAPLIGEIAAAGEEVFEFQPGMCFSCEPAILVPNVPGGGGVRLEDTILVTETGNEILTKYPYCDELLG
ncbi:MAG: aminopeptidase P family protein [Clostridiales bacterium]|jgi:Xaa-Pro aminopeptidase|nr:aminopeptidase P family protein [Clostridiales bacterium]HQA60820.1 Xaa-Pro peptidase family protein [Tepidanaerobacteraceae bacterium]